MTFATTIDAIVARSEQTLVAAFRTPLHAILGPSKLLLDATDGPLTAEQAKQVRFIRTSAEELSTLVTDLLDLSYSMLEAASGPAGIRLAREERPDVILLDFLLDQMTAFDVLDDLKADPRTRRIPVVIVTSHLLDSEDRKRLAAETEAILSKDSLSRELAINRIRDALHKSGVGARRPQS